MSDPLTDDHALLSGEAVDRDLEVQGCRTLPDTARNIVMRTVARAEPTAKVTGFANGDTTKVSADT